MDGVGARFSPQKAHLKNLVGYSLNDILDVRLDDGIWVYSIVSPGWGFSQLAKMMNGLGEVALATRKLFDGHYVILTTTL